MKITRPFVTVSYAQSACGHIATRTGDSQWISSDATLDFSHELRRDNEAILVGIGTAMADDPELTCRRVPCSTQPLRVVLDSNFRLPLDAKLMTTLDLAPTLVVGVDADGDVDVDIQHRREALENAGASTVTVADNGGRPDLGAVLDLLGNRGITSLYVEGGMGVLTSFVGSGLVDRLHLVSAPIFLGAGVPALGDLGIDILKDAPRGVTSDVAIRGGDVIWTMDFPRETFEARAVWFDGKSHAELRRETLTAVVGQRLFEARLLGISAGTEGRYFRGEVPEGPLEDALPGAPDHFAYPVKFGYQAVGGFEAGGSRFAFLPHQNRAFVAEEATLEVPGDVPDDDAIFAAAMETAVSIVQDCAPVLGERILVLGTGVVGTLVGLLLDDFGGVDIDLWDSNDDRRRAVTEAVGLGFAEPTGLYDAAINLTGSGAALQVAIDLCRPEGRILEASWYGGRKIDVGLGGSFHRKRLKVVATQVSTIGGALSPRWEKNRRFDLVWDALRRHKPKRLISHRFGLEDAQEAMETALAPSSLQVVLTANR